MVTNGKRRQFTVRGFQQQFDAGILDEDERSELPEGESVETPPLTPPPMSSVNRGTRDFVQALGNRAVARPHNADVLGLRNVPQPGLALLAGRDDPCAGMAPAAEGRRLVIEIADTSLQRDRVRKGVPEYGASALNGGWSTVCRDPAPRGHRTVQVNQCSESIAPLALPDLTVPVEAVLGPRTEGR
ncbi:MAG: hypothetical protein RMM58_14950 [Chloroflexota bacterium]|nr:Uma2 family endonuclease [Dehalococcoidia bacterium]MDW8255172.1 hypothetical protein [Chloroflexota bacterium]